MFYGWYIVAACFLISGFTAGTAIFGFTAVIDPIIREFGWSYTQVSLASSIRGLQSGLLVPLIGMLMDRWGPRRLVFGGAFIIGVGMLLISRVPTLALFYGATIIIAMGLSAMATMLMMTAVAGWFRKNLGLAMGIAASGVALGGLLVPVVTYLIDTYGWRTSMVVIGIGTWLIPLPLSLVLRHKPEQYGYRPDGIKEPLSGENRSPTKPETSIGAKEALLSWPFWVIGITYLFSAMPIAAITTHIMPYFNSIGVDRSSASIIASAAPLITIIGRIGFGWLADRFDNKRVTFLSFILMAIGVLILPFITVHRPWLISFCLLFYGIGWGGSVPMSSILVRVYFGPDSLSTIVGFIGGLLMVGMFIGSPLAGWVYDQWGHYQPVWYFIAAVVSAAGLMFLLLLRNTPTIDQLPE